MIHASLDTSAGVALAIAKDNAILFNGQLASSGRDSDRQLLPFVTARLAECGLTPRDVTHWTVGIGPGSFAGLRCGIAMLKGFRLVSGAALRGVPTSCALAAQAANGRALTVGVLHDGRCNQVLLARIACSGAGELKLLEAPEPLDPAQLLEDTHQCDCYATLSATALPALPEAIATKLIRLEALDAAKLLDASESLYPWPADDAATEGSTAPLYVRQAVFVRPATLRV
jgi:tRNA threonylcarbamoyl adenosine modification protein YeaZ